MSRRMREAWVDLTKSFQPTLAVTLDGGLTIRPESLRNKAEHFLNAVQREARGRNWHRFSREPSLIAIGFVERAELNTHLHLATTGEGAVRRVLLNGHDLWRSVRSAGHYYCDPIEETDGYINYITKGMWDPRNEEARLVYVGPGRERGLMRMN